MLRKLLGKATFKQAPVDPSGRVPPGQYVTTKMPVMSANSTPKVDLTTWRLRIFGEVETALEFTWDEFMALAQTDHTSDFHCVTQWSRLDVAWEGVPVRLLLERAQPRA
ncbi:MAG: molybdopterin-dependent oxidoreductase, partial [Chloroflexi bacterium]|nr:molybdopterin-dependent oxidoreductase [Chloroflexota bacterium]